MKLVDIPPPGLGPTLTTPSPSGVLFPESDGGHYDVETDAAHNKDGVVYKKEVLTISRVQSSDLGEYEATASYNDDRYINRVDLRLTNVGSTVVSVGCPIGLLFNSIFYYPFCRGIHLLVFNYTQEGLFHQTSVNRK